MGYSLEHSEHILQALTDWAWFYFIVWFSVSCFFQYDLYNFVKVAGGLYCLRNYKPLIHQLFDFVSQNYNLIKIQELLEKCIIV